MTPAAQVIALRDRLDRALLTDPARAAAATELERRRAWTRLADRKARKVAAEADATRGNHAPPLWQPGPEDAA